MSAPRLSLVVPVYFEQECIEQFIAETREVLVKEDVDYEIVFVDDGSRDRTVELIRAAAKEDPRLKLVELSYNHGKQGALTAGFSYARGELLLMMDPDLQDPPVEIPRFLRAIEADVDVVYGIRIEKHDSPLNKLFSKIFWWILERFTGLEFPRGLAVMRIFTRRFADRLLRYREQNRFIEGMFMHVGMRRANLVITQRPRFAGVSKFNFTRKLDLAFTAIFDFSDLPLRMTTRFGVAMVGFGVLFLASILLRKLIHAEMQLGWASLIGSLIVGFGLQIFFMGVVGQYIGRIYRETKQRPLFTVAATTNLEPRPDLGA